MGMDKKPLALVIITIIFVFGMTLEPSSQPPSAVRYIITDIGQFLIILMAALIGFGMAKSFAFGSALGRSMVCISLGMLSWGIGALLWLYYNVALQIEVPYPSPAEVFYLGTIPLATLGMFWLLKSIKIRFDRWTALKLTILPVIAFLLTYWLFIQSKLAEDVPVLIKTLNVAYPVGDVIFLSFALVIWSLIRGGKLLKPVSIICVGFVIEAMADFTFSWTTSLGTYYVGSLADILFALAFFTLGLGMHYTSELKTG